MMKQKYIPLLVIVLLPFLVILNGCEESKSGGSGAIDLGRGEPNIVESVLAISVHEDRPDGITDTFSAEVNDQVYLWLLWENIEESHTVEVSWFSPEDDLDDPPFWNEKRTISSTTGEKITWFYIDAPTGGLSGDQFATGEWFVEIFLDGLFERSHLFYVE
ncbi:MAG: hypothetical protein OXI67_01610 [Candidatus Poribacteria bacterium]|nr:hypothetical protein [Candidatus Poribacteria bacterium]